MTVWKKGLCHGRKRPELGSRAYVNVLINCLLRRSGALALLCKRCIRRERPHQHCAVILGNRTNKYVFIDWLTSVKKSERNDHFHMFTCHRCISFRGVGSLSVLPTIYLL